MFPVRNTNWASRSQPDGPRQYMNILTQISVSVCTVCPIRLLLCMSKAPKAEQVNSSRRRKHTPSQFGHVSSPSPVAAPAACWRTDWGSLRGPGCVGTAQSVGRPVELYWSCASDMCYLWTCDRRSEREINEMCQNYCTPLWIFHFDGILEQIRIANWRHFATRNNVNSLNVNSEHKTFARYLKSSRVLI